MEEKEKNVPNQEENNPGNLENVQQEKAELKEESKADEEKPDKPTEETTPGAETTDKTEKHIAENAPGDESEDEPVEASAAAPTEEVPSVENEAGKSKEDRTENSSGEVPAEKPASSEPEESAAENQQVEASEEATDDLAAPGSSEPIASESDGDQDDHTDDAGNSEDDHHEEEQLPDFDNYSKEQLTEFLVSMKEETDMRKVDRVLKEIRPFFDEIHNSEREEALKQFMAGSDEADEADFEYKGDEVDRRFIDYYDLLKSKRHEFFNNLEKQKEANLKRKLEILDEIRELVDGEETNVSINSIRKLQEEWKQVGPVPAAQNRTLWANYNALLDRYYDARSIYFELKELDRKKNLDAKLEVVARAEELDKLENIKDAITQLNELHEEFKHIGPVPKEEQEPLWQRFKAASDAIYAKRKEYSEHLKKELHENLEKKQALGEAVQAFVDFDSDRINDWNAKTKEILELQRKWEAIGGLPRDKAKETNKRFWGAFKKFFSNKNAFFKKLEAKRGEYLEQKRELVKRAEELKDSTDWNKTADELKKLQQQWKEIGPVPEKYRNEVYKQFKAACDHFFEQRRAQNQEQNKEFEENYQKKMEICQEMEKLSESDNLDLDTVYDLVDQYAEIGFVPRNMIKKTHNRFDEVCARLLKNESLSEQDMEDLRINIQVNKLKGSPHGGRKLQRKENALRRKINTLENDINTWKTNLEFFASSKKADALKDDFEDKIEKATAELEDLRKQLEILHQA